MTTKLNGSDNAFSRVSLTIPVFISSAFFLNDVRLTLLSSSTHPCRFGFRKASIKKRQEELYTSRFLR